MNPSSLPRKSRFFHSLTQDPSFRQGNQKSNSRRNREEGWWLSSASHFFLFMLSQVLESVVFSSWQTNCSMIEGFYRIREICGRPFTRSSFYFVQSWRRLCAFYQTYISLISIFERTSLIMITTRDCYSVFIIHVMLTVAEERERESSCLIEREDRKDCSNTNYSSVLLLFSKEERFFPNWFFLLLFLVLTRKWESLNEIVLWKRMMMNQFIILKRKRGREKRLKWQRGSYYPYWEEKRCDNEKS